MSEFEPGVCYSYGDSYVLFIAYHPFHPVCICEDYYGQLLTLGFDDLELLDEEK